MDWLVLGIEPTKDKKVITSAYRSRLRDTNPEDKPEEFKSLRAAYEEALRLADEEDASVEDTSPVGIWMHRVKELYSDYGARIRWENWKRLLCDDVLIGLDTRPKAEEAILTFLMENFYIPQAVWQLLDETFHLRERREELYERYPREFIDQAVMNGIRFEASLPYDLFIPGSNAADCDAYRRLYYQANQVRPAEAAEYIQKMDALSERHPYGMALKCRYLMETGRAEEGREGFHALAEEYPDNVSLNNAWASICLEEGNFEEAEVYAKKVLDQVPDHNGAKQIMAECRANGGKLQEAKDLVMEILHSANGDPAILDRMSELMRSWNEVLIGKYTARMREHPEDTANAIELAWCYLQNERFEEALETALTIDPNRAPPFDYHNLMGKLYQARQEPDKALEHMHLLVNLLQEMKPDGTEETEKRLRRLPEMLQFEGACLMQLGQTGEAMGKLERALELAPENPEVLYIMGKALFANAEYERSAQTLRRMTEAAPNSWHAYVLMALAYDKLRDDSRAYEAISCALPLAPSDLSCYIIKMQLLIRNGAFDEVRETIGFLRENGVPENISVDFAEAQLIELQDKNENEAFKRYQEIARQAEAGEYLFWASQLYYRMAVIMGRQMDPRQEEDSDILVSVLQKGLAYDEQDEDCLDYMAWLFKQSGRVEEALEVYHDLEAKQPHSLAVESNLADLYYTEVSKYAEKALKYYEFLMERRPGPAVSFFAATCKRHLGDLAGAERYYEMEMQLDPDDVDAYNGLAFVYETQGRYGEAIASIDTAIRIMDESGNEYPWLIDHKIKLLRRQGDFRQALDIVQDAMGKYQYPDGYRVCFDICCQFGLWDQARAYLDLWKKNQGNDPYIMASTARLHLLQGRMFQAAAAMGKVKHKLDFEEIQDFRLQLNELEGNLSRQIQIWERRVGSGYDITRSLMSLAQALWYAGKEKAARETAEKALQELDAVLEQHLTDEALYRSRRALVLALLGRQSQAREELARVRSMPLCEFCEYGQCKDADIYEAAIEDLCGSRDKALELYRAGKRKWPDELDFISGEVRLKRKKR